MNADRFRKLADATGPFISIYFDDSHDTADAAAQLDARLRDIRKHLEDESVDASVIETIENAVRAKHPPVGRSGRGVITAGSTVVLDEHLAVPPVSTSIRVSDAPYIVPVIEHGMLHACYLLVEVDHTGADITLRDGSSHTEAVEGSGHPVHTANKAETAGYGGPQGRVEEAVRKNIREVADRVTHLFDEHDLDVVFVTGEVEARAELVAALPERVAQKVVQLQGGGRAAGIDEAEVQNEIGEEFARLRVAALDDVVERFAAGHGRGLAIDGLAEVTAALRGGAVETLIIGDLGEATAADDRGRVLPADEVLPLLAVATGAALVRTDDRLKPADGVGAVLRYAATNSTG